MLVAARRARRSNRVPPTLVPVTLAATRVAVVALALLAAASRAAAQTAVGGEPSRGEMLFQFCFSCHSLDPAEQNLPGPNLNGILGRPAGKQPGFKYSSALRQAADKGLVWTAENLDQWLADPQGFLPATSMDFIGMRDASDRLDLTRYLQGNSR
jgi:cytochrome c2